MKRRLLVPGLLTSAFLVMRCGGSGGGSGDDAGNAAGEAGSAGTQVSGGNGGTSGATAGSAGSRARVCDPGETRACVGPGNCDGGQQCRSDGSAWTPCDCGSGTGGGGGSLNTGGAGNASSGGEAGQMSAGGSGAVDGEGGLGGEAGQGGDGQGGDDGASGSGASGQGGSGGASAAGGTAGEGGAAGTPGAGGANGGAGGSLDCGPSVGLELIPAAAETETAWIDRDTNCLGIEGAVYLVKDSAGSNIYFTSRNGRLCVAGHAEQVAGEDFAAYWGVAVAIQLNNRNGNALPYDADTHDVDGFAFTLSGDAVPAEIRPRYRVDGSGTEYCKKVCADGAQSLLLDDAHASCWNGTSGANPNHANLTLLEFHIPSNASGDVPFDFCIDDITAVKDDTSVGNPGTCSGDGTGGTGGTGGSGGSGGSGGGGNADSCVGHCGDASESGNCYCDYECELNYDCCDDYQAECG